MSGFEIRGDQNSRWPYLVNVRFSCWPLRMGLVEVWTPPPNRPTPCARGHRGVVVDLAGRRFGSALQTDMRQETNEHRGGRRISRLRESVGVDRGAGVTERHGVAHRSFRHSSPERDWC